MSISAPVLGRRLVLEFDAYKVYGMPWPIKVFDDGDPDFLTVQYPDNSWQKQPRVWWSDKIRREARSGHTTAVQQTPTEQPLIEPVRPPAIKRIQLRPISRKG